MSLLGAEGLNRVATQSCIKTHQLAEALTAIPGVSAVFTSPYFHEVCLTFNKPVASVLSALKQAGIAGGYPVHKHFPGLAKDALLICATETRTEDDINLYIDTIRQTLKGG